VFPLTANPRMVSEGDFPAAGTSAEQLCFLLNYAILAPSEYNTQPWLFKVSERTAELYADRSRRLPIVDPEDRELTISCGAALFNLRVALRQFGYTDEVEVLARPDAPNALARVSLGRTREATEEDHQLFQAIQHRLTNRQAFNPREVPSALLATLSEQAEGEGAWFHVVRREETRRILTNLIMIGDRLQWADKQFRRELAAWARPPHDKERQDGLPGYTQSKGSFASSISPFFIRTFDMGDEEAIKDHLLAAGSPVLAVLGTFNDTWWDWLAAGQAAQKLLLYACAEGVQGSFFNQPIELAPLRSILRDLIGRGGFPQLVLRLGYGPAVPPTPRRSVSEVLLL
jgi:nitroreductase